MSKYKLKYLIVNNFRNIEYNSEIKKDTKIEDIADLKHKWFYKFWWEKLTIFDGENGYGKTTFFYALEFLFLWEKIDLEIKAKEHSIIKEKKWDVLRNSKNENEFEYFVRWIFENDNWDTIDIIRFVEENKEIEDAEMIQLKDWKIIHNINPKDLDFWIDFENHYKNFLYLPQDNVFEFLLDGWRWKSVNKILNLEEEEYLLWKLKNSSNQNDIKTIYWKINSTITKLDYKNNELAKKNHEITKDIEILKENLKEKNDLDLSNYKNIAFFTRNYDFIDIENLENINEKELKINSFSRNFDGIKYILENIDNYKYKIYNDKINKLNDSKVLFEIWNYNDFIYCFENNDKKDYKYKDVKSNLLKLNSDLTNLEELNAIFNNLYKLQSIESIQKISISNFKKYESIIDVKVFLDFVENIQKELKEIKSDSQKYEWLKKNIQYIFDNVSNESYKSIEIVDENWNIKNETFCPTCWTDFWTYKDLKDSIKSQLKYFSDKSSDTKNIDEKIKIFYLSIEFLNLQSKIIERIESLKKEKENFEKISWVLKTYESFFWNKDLEDFIKINKENFNENNHKETFDNYILSLEEKRPKINITDINLWYIKAEINEEFKRLFNSNDAEILLDYKFLFSVTDIDVNKSTILTYKDTLIYQKGLTDKNDELKKNGELIKYLEKRRNILENIKTKFWELYSNLYSTINEYENKLSNNIKVPFYIFSKRILKNYEWDWLVLTKDNNKVSITSLNYQKNPVFNFSQWQLTATMISILLALNISLNNSKINFLLIDDPIQTLDDLNQLAFINLLRYQFADKQIILSTHEQEFSNFIRYKFWRLWLSQISFNVKERFLK